MNTHPTSKSAAQADPQSPTQAESQSPTQADRTGIGARRQQNLVGESRLAVIMVNFRTPNSVAESLKTLIVQANEWESDVVAWGEAGPPKTITVYVVENGSADGSKYAVECHIRELNEVLRDSECQTPKTSICLLYTSPSPRDATLSRMPSSA